MAWADNKNFMLRQEAAGKATPSQKTWLAKWRAAGSPETQAGMSSPAPTDDVISMGGTFDRLVSQGHEVHIAYQTSGNIAVSDHDALRYLEVGPFVGLCSSTYFNAFSGTARKL